MLNNDSNNKNKNLIITWKTLFTMTTVILTTTVSDVTGRNDVEQNERAALAHCGRPVLPFRQPPISGTVREGNGDGN